MFVGSNGQWKWGWLYGYTHVGKVIDNSTDSCKEWLNFEIIY